MATQRSGPLRSRALWAAGVAALLLAGFGAVLFRSGGEGEPLASDGLPSGAGELLRLLRENRILRMEVELAHDARPYLVLDLESHRLVLKADGVPLRDFRVRGASIHARRLLGLRGGVASALDTVWGPGRLLPRVRRERVEIVADTVTPPDPSGTVAYVPPTPEEAVPTPSTFRLRYAGDRSLLVRAAGDLTGVAEGERGFSTGGGEAGAEGQEGILRERSPPGRFLHWLRMAPWLRDRLRLEVTLSPAEAGALYRAHADGTPLMVLGPDPSSVERK